MFIWSKKLVDNIILKIRSFFNVQYQHHTAVMAYHWFKCDILSLLEHNHFPKTEAIIFFPKMEAYDTGGKENTVCSLYTYKNRAPIAIFVISENTLFGVTYDTILLPENEVFLLYMKWRLYFFERITLSCDTRKNEFMCQSRMCFIIITFITKPNHSWCHMKPLLLLKCIWNITQQVKCLQIIP